MQYGGYFAAPAAIPDEVCAARGGAGLRLRTLVSALGRRRPNSCGVPVQVRTIFVTGFPDDVKERELNNLLRFLPGYEVGGPVGL